MKKFLPILISCVVWISLAAVGCTDDQRTRETLTKAGFTEIETTGFQYFACSDSDDYHTGFRAKNPQGVVVTGVVCCGIMKSCTIRF